MPPTLQHIALTDIALDDTTFVVTYRPLLQDLQRSVARVGVLTPLHLRRPATSAPLQIVCGSKRLQVCQLTGQTQVPALVYNADELAEEQAFLLALHDNLGCRALNVVEKARTLQRLHHTFHYPLPTLVSDICALLDLPRRADTVEAYCTVASLDDGLQRALVEGALALETALWLASRPPTDHAALLALFTGLKLGSNRAREFAALIDEICLRDTCSASVLLQQLDIPSLVADPQRPGPQKIEQVRRFLRQTRYPHLSTYEQRFQDTLRHLRLPSQITLRPPPYFEGEQYQVSFAFRQPQELQHYAQRLLDAASMPAIDELFDLL